MRREYIENLLTRPRTSGPKGVGGAGAVGGGREKNAVPIGVKIFTYPSDRGRVSGTCQKIDGPYPFPTRNPYSGAPVPEGEGGGARQFAPPSQPRTASELKVTGNPSGLVASSSVGCSKLRYYRPRTGAEQVTRKTVTGYR